MTKRLIPNRTVAELQIEADAIVGSDGDEARLAVAQQYGFRTWRRLEVYLQNGRTEGEGKLDFLQYACLDYQTQNFERARAIAETTTDLSSRDIYHACCMGDVAAVRSMLKSDPTLVNQPGGYFDWEPLLYACYSRLDLPGHSTLDVVKCLLEHKADPNAHYMWGGQYRFTALTGAFGEGENGAANCPEHKHCEPLARLLLEAGADPNDSQALYNRMFTQGSTCLEMLLEFGLGPEHRCNWLLEENGQYIPSPVQTLGYQLGHAMRHGHSHRARLCIEHGADLATVDGERSFYKTAMLTGDPELAEYLVAQGAERVELEPTAEFAAACLSNNETKARAMMADNPRILNQTQAAFPELVSFPVDARRYDTLRLLVKLGVDLNRGGFPLHSAAWSGDLQMVQLLIELGLNPRDRDGSHHATPMQWASHHADRADIMDFLSTCDIDIFDAVLCENRDRIKQLIAATPSLLETTYGEARGAIFPADGDSRTPLASAVVRKKFRAVNTLLSLGANRDYTEDGKTLLDIAREDSSAEIIELLSH